MSGEWKRKESPPKILLSYLPLQLSHFLPATFPPHPLPNPPAMYIITFIRLKYKAIFFLLPILSAILLVLILILFNIYT